MAKTKLKSKEQHREQIQLEVCRRDYLLMETYHTALLEAIERASDGGCTKDEIMRWVKSLVTERELLQRTENAVRYAERLKQ